MAKLLKNSKLSSPVMFSKFASDLQIEELAISEIFYVRTPLKVTATSFVSGFFGMKSNGENSLCKWAFFTGMQNGQVVSKQGIDERLHERTQKYVSALFEQAMKLKMQEQFKRGQGEELANLTSLFNRILVEDSTAQKVPAQLAELFKGLHSRGGAPCGNLEGTGDLRFYCSGLGSFRRYVLSQKCPKSKCLHFGSRSKRRFNFA